MESSKQDFQFEIEEMFAQVMFNETKKEFFAGRHQFVDPLQDFFESASLSEKLNEKFEQFYEFENAVVNFFEFFKKNRPQQQNIQGA